MEVSWQYTIVANMQNQRMKIILAAAKIGRTTYGKSSIRGSLKNWQINGAAKLIM